MDFENYGKKVKKIPVSLNYRIIELFSAGLYSSPNKAFEELVSNSYDAYATQVCVFIPQEITKKSMMVVCDNGDSMNLDELKELWQIGKSKKLEIGKKNGRLQIGQFGIGKLATYVLADKLTYLCKKKGQIHLVSMDYNSIPKQNKQRTIRLDVLRVEETKAQELVNEVLKQFPSPQLPFELFGENSEGTWTFVILSDIKDKGQEISSGRLSWIFSTALPINPEFKLIFNNDLIQSSKSSGTVLKKWVLGKDDGTPSEKLKYTVDQEGDIYHVNLPHLKRIHGEVTLYQDTLTGGKSEEWGRSHGIFLMIRNRLINTENPLINGLGELNHATFNRMRFIINADDLNSELTSGREMVKNSEKYTELLEYIKFIFHKVHAFWAKQLEDLSEGEAFSKRVSNTSPFYSKIPIYEAAKKVLDGSVSGLLLTTVPSDMSAEHKEKFLSELDAEITNPKIELMKEFSLENELTVDDPIAKFNLGSRQIDINTRHPFYIAFLSEFKGKSHMMYSLIASNEIFTEASLVEKGVDEELVRDIIKRRDTLFREFSRHTENNIFTATMFLKNSLSNAKDLEKALHMCFECLGFQVEPMGATGTPDGKATARLGVWDGKNESYTFTYEAKSTKDDKIGADTTKTGVVKRHKEKNGADFALEVAIDYDGSTDPESNANWLAEDDGVTLVRAKDFWRLIVASIPNRLNFVDFKDFLNTCKKVTDSQAWIDKFCERKVEKLPYKEILESAWNIMDEDPKEAPTIGTVRQKAGIVKTFSVSEVKDMFKTLQQMIPQLISLEGEKVRLLVSPDKILNHLNKTIEDQAPQDLRERLEHVFKKNLDS